VKKNTKLVLCSKTQIFVGQTFQLLKQLLSIK